MQALYDFIAGTLTLVAWIYILLPVRIRRRVVLHNRFRGRRTGYRRFGYAMKNTFGKIFKKT